MSGPKSIGRRALDSVGAVTIAELLVILAVGSILFVAVMHGHTFIDRISKKFFDNTTLETEGRLLLQMIEDDLSSAQSVSRPEPNHWRLGIWPNRSVDYQYLDSTVLRNGQRLPSHETIVGRFAMWADTSLSDLAGHFSENDGRCVARSVSVRVSVTLTHRGKSMDFDIHELLRKRSPG